MILPTGYAEERSWAHTASYTAALTSLVAVANILAEPDERLDLTPLPDAVRATLEVEEIAHRLAAGMVDANHPAVVRRHHWPHTLLSRVRDGAKEVGRALGDVDVRVLLEEDERRRFLGIIARHSQRMERLVKDLLRLARLDAGQETLDLIACDTHSLADAVVRATNGRWEVGTSSAGGASMAVTWPRMLARSSATRAAASETQPPLARLDA